jgi:hypothetical protein
MEAEKPASTLFTRSAKAIAKRPGTHECISRWGLVLVISMQYVLAGLACADKSLQFDNQKFSEERNVVLNLLSKEIAEAESMPNADKVQVRIALSDLNKDSKPDILAFLDQTPYFCGTAGCRFLVLIAGRNGQWKPAIEDVITQENIRIGSHSTRGYADIIIDGNHWIWDGKRRYVRSKKKVNNDTR